MLKGTMNKLEVVGIAVIVLVVVIVVLQNTQTVETKLLFLTVTMPVGASERNIRGTSPQGKEGEEHDGKAKKSGGRVSRLQTDSPGRSTGV